MFSKLKQFFKKKSKLNADLTITKTQLLKVIHKYIKRYGNFGTAALIFIDLDDFRNLIEIYGEAVCQEILHIIIKRLKVQLPSNASLCKTSLDGILIFIPDETIQGKIDKLCKKLLENIRVPMDALEEKNIQVTASIGVCTYPQSGNTVKELLENLEIATFVSKRGGGNKFTNHYATLSEDEKNNMMYYEEIKTAIQKREFILYYQPIIDMEHKTLFGAEALMRWNHPTKGVLPPQDFIQLMEQTGDIHWVGEWGIDRMIRFQQQMAIKYPNLPLIFSLNLCLKQLLNPNLAKNLINIAMQLSAKPSRIMLEITDFMVYEKMSVVEANITKLKSFGFRIAVDGFPIDPQSVLAIQKCPVDVIKLERGFLKDVTNNFSQEKLLVSLVDYCKKTKKIIVSEGIESMDKVKYILDQKVTFGSGFYFARPLDIPSLNNYVEKKQWLNQLDMEEFDE